MKDGCEPMETTVLVVDGYPIVRHALRELFAQQGFQVVGVAGSGAEALQATKTLRPQVVVQEWNIEGDEDGGDLCRSLKKSPWPVQVLVYSASATSDAVVGALSAGADSYLHKSSGVDVLVDVLRRTCAGERVWLPRHQTGRDRLSEITEADHFAMTPREKDVLVLLLQRYSNHEIASRLHLAHQTVKNHVSCVLRKLGATNRRDLGGLHLVA
jgi:DNA-binding NarL/FixJ family response regulator